MGDGPTGSQGAASGGRPAGPGAPRPTSGADRGEPPALAAARRLLRATTEQEAATVVIDLVRALGGALEPPSPRAAGQLPVDVTFGTTDPLVPAGDPSTLARLASVLPAVVEDAHVALSRIRRETHLTATAGTDALTGLTSRRVGMRVLGRSAAGDAVAMLDLDHFKRVNDQLGHDAGDDVLRSFAAVLRAVLRAADTASRLGGDEFLLLLPRTSLAGAEALLDRARDAWEARRPQPVGFSAGLTTVGADGGPAALVAADRALYTAKDAGRDRVEVVR